MNKQSIYAFFSILVLIAVSFSAHAHTGASPLQTFTDGFIHPWLGADHLLAMSAIGLWAVLSGGRCLWLLPLSFFIAMAAGAMVSFSAIAINAVELWVALSVLMLGLIVSINRRMSTAIACTLVALFALGHGYVHAAEISYGADVFSYSMGFLSATAALHVTGMTTAFLGPSALKLTRTVFGLICTLTGMVLLAGI